jgi:E3 ubiquitin-protein ligase MARCH6
MVMIVHRSSLDLLCGLSSYVRLFQLTCAIFFGSDLFAFAVGFCILSTIFAASRDAFAYAKSGRTRLLISIICNWGTTALKSSPLLFLWVS